MNSYNIIGDIAGNYETLMALINKMPDGEVISIGDMVDRGPKSREVIEWFMENGRAVLGNHEHMMIDWAERGGFYGSGIWMANGGSKTLDSFGLDIPEKVVDWVKKLPLNIELDGVLVSHAFVHPGVDLVDAKFLGNGVYDHRADRSIIWNRSAPIRRPEYKMQVAGHNSQFGLERFSDESGEFAICIDSSRERVLTGIHLPSLEIYQQEYIDEPST